MTKNVYLVGSHSVGKTTLARHVHGKYGLSLITEVARQVLATSETTIEQVRRGMSSVNVYQRQVFEAQLAREAATLEPFVSDRGPDNVAYAAEHSTIAAELVGSKAFTRYVKSIQERGVVFFVRPDERLLVGDGVREAPDWSSICRIDGMVKFLLECFDIPYVEVATCSLQSRTRLIDQIIDRENSAFAVEEVER